MSLNWTVLIKLVRVRLLIINDKFNEYIHISLSLIPDLLSYFVVQQYAIWKN